MLEKMQALFARTLADASLEPALIAHLEMCDPRTTARINLYRGNMHALWERALADAFPVVKQLVGADFFAGLARDYGHACPSRSGDLNQFGDRFAAFISTDIQARSLAYLADVARLEWLVHRAHFAADGVPIDRMALAQMRPEGLLAANFMLHPACVWIASSFSIASIWQAHQPQGAVEMPAMVDQAEVALVVRPAWQARVLSSSVAEVCALDTLRSGAGMAAAIRAALVLDDAYDFATALPRWLDFAVLVARAAQGLPASRSA